MLITNIVVKLPRLALQIEMIWNHSLVQSVGQSVRFCCLVLIVCYCMQCCHCSLSLHLRMHMLCMFYAHAAHVCCVWGKPTKGVRIIDSFRVNGW